MTAENGLDAFGREDTSSWSERRKETNEDVKRRMGGGNSGTYGNDLLGFSDAGSSLEDPYTMILMMNHLNDFSAQANWAAHNTVYTDPKGRTWIGTDDPSSIPDGATVWGWGASYGVVGGSADGTKIAIGRGGSNAGLPTLRSILASNPSTRWGGSGDGSGNVDTSSTSTTNSNTLVIYNSSAKGLWIDSATGKDFSVAANAIDAVDRVDAASWSEVNKRLPQLKGYGKYSTVYIIEHGAQGSQHFGGFFFTGLQPDSPVWSTIAGAVSPSGSIRLLGCQVGNGQIGTDYVNALRGDRNIFVGANMNDTGYDDGGIQWNTVNYEWGSKKP